MFPKAKFPFAIDLRKLDDEKISALYTKWQEKVAKDRMKKGISEDKSRKNADKIPVRAFSEILAVVSPPLLSRDRGERKLVMTKLAPVQETMSAVELEAYASKAFVKRFGKALQGD